MLIYTHNTIILSSTAYRELQKQFDDDADVPALIPVENTCSSDFTEESPCNVASYDEKTAPDRSTLHRNDSIADDSESFPIYHFNGLEAHGRSARLSKFLLYKRSSNNAVGQSIALSGGGGGESQFANSHLEEILRTRWPGCRVDYLGQNAPCID